MTSPPRPGQTTPNELEFAILERLAGKEISLRDCVDRLHVLRREFTGVGSFTTFAGPKSPNESNDLPIGLDGSIRVPGVPNGMGAVLFCRGGWPKILELYTFGEDHWDGVYDGFSIEPAN